MDSKNYKKNMQRKKNKETIKKKSKQSKTEPQKNIYVYENNVTAILIFRSQKKR